MVKVLLTGGTGFIGQYLVQKLVHSGKQLRIVCRNAEKASRLPRSVNVETVFADVYDSANHSALFRGCSSLIHLAWEGLPNYGQPFHVERNLPAEINFMRAAVDSGIQKILVAGTCFEYGKKYGPLEVNTICEPNTYYGIAKNALRQFLFELGAKSNIHLKWGRIFYVYGPGQSQSSLFGQLEKAIGSGDIEFKMSDGQQIRDYSHVGEVADQLEVFFEDDSIGIRNICSGNPISVRSMVEKIVNECGSNIKLKLGYYQMPDYESLAFWGKK